jgi:hypothetical protein
MGTATLTRIDKGTIAELFWHTREISSVGGQESLTHLIPIVLCPELLAGYPENASLQKKEVETALTALTSLTVANFFGIVLFP